MHAKVPYEPQQCEVCYLVLCEFVGMDIKEKNTQQSILRVFFADKDLWFYRIRIDM